MRLLALGIVLLGLAVLARAAYLVDFGSGDRMTVDAYREDGDWVHLRRGMEDLSVPRDRVRALLDESGRKRVEPPTADRSSPPPGR
jgi:hypothetical protein